MAIATRTNGDAREQPGRDPRRGSSRRGRHSPTTRPSSTSRRLSRRPRRSPTSTSCTRDLRGEKRRPWATADSVARLPRQHRRTAWSGARAAPCPGRWPMRSPTCSTRRRLVSPAVRSSRRTCWTLIVDRARRPHSILALLTQMQTDGSRIDSVLARSSCSPIMRTPCGSACARFAEVGHC